MKAARWTVKRDVVAQLARQPMTKAQLCEATGLRDSQVQNVLSRLRDVGHAERIGMRDVRRSTYRLLVPAEQASWPRKAAAAGAPEPIICAVPAQSSTLSPTWPKPDQALGEIHRKPSSPRWRIAA